MSKSSKVNRRGVLGAIKSGNVTGTDLRSCAVSIVAELRAHPVHVGKVEEILSKLFWAKEIRICDAQLRCVEATPKRVARSRPDRSAQRKVGRITRYLEHSVLEGIPEQWIGVNPDDYATGVPVSPAGGWADDDDVFDHHLDVCRRNHDAEQELMACIASQFLDLSEEMMGKPAEHDFVLQDA